MQGEQLIINEDSTLSRSIRTVTAHSIDDVKSVYQDSTAITAQLKQDFIADTVLDRINPTGFGIGDTVEITTAGAMTSPGKFFNNLKVGDIIRYQIGGVAAETFNRISAISADLVTVTLTAVEDRANVCDGGLPAADYTGSFTVGQPFVRDNGGLFAPLEETSVSSVELADSNLLVSVQLREKTTDSVGSLQINVSDTNISNARFEAFDQERYSVHYNDGSIETLSSDQVDISANGQLLTFTGLTVSQSSNVTVNVTVKKIGITNKTKNLTRSTKLELTQSATGISTTLASTTQSDFYGTRVQDREISLNVPDAVDVIAVYESLGTSTPSLDSLEFPAGLALNTESVLGERLVGQTSNAIAQLVTRSSATTVEIVYLTQDTFVAGENVSFEESGIIAPLQVIGLGNYNNITRNYDLNKAVGDQFYDYSRIEKKDNISYVPSKNFSNLQSLHSSF